MPFHDDYFDTYHLAMLPASINNNANCIRVDHEKFIGDILEKIYIEIQESAAVVADVSNSRPNVLFEMGYAKGLGKPIIQICSTSANELPFDISHNKTIFYKMGQIYKLKPKLESELASILSQIPQ